MCNLFRMKFSTMDPCHQIFWMIKFLLWLASFSIKRLSVAILVTSSFNRIRTSSGTRLFTPLLSVSLKFSFAVKLYNWHKFLSGFWTSSQQSNDWRNLYDGWARTTWQKLESDSHRCSIWYLVITTETTNWWEAIKRVITGYLFQICVGKNFW